MKFKNILLAAPAWLSNVLSIVLASLLAVSTIGNDFLALFGEINCQDCIKITQEVLSVTAILLSVAKAFTAIDTKMVKLNTKAALTIILGILIFTTIQQLMSKQFGSDPQYHNSSTLKA